MADPERVTYTATIDGITEVAPDTRSFTLHLPPTSGFTFSPGQFISCLLPVAGERLIRPYSVASPPEDLPTLEICLNRVAGGRGSGYLFGLFPGATLTFTGPWGTFRLDRQPDTETVFLAEGLGIVPIRPMLRRALETGTRPVRLWYAAPTPDHLLYGTELAATATTNPRFTYSPLVATSLEAAVEASFITADTQRSRAFYICGVGDIVTRLRDRLRAAGYERRAVQYEKW